jgi:hypothetical protein
MRETRSFSPPIVKPTLEVVRSQFETWRKRRLQRGRIPEALWQAAAELCKEYPVYEVSRSLRLNYNGLKHRVPEAAQERSRAVGERPDFGFVRLDLGAPITSSECLVEMEAPNGARMRMSFKGVLGDVDPVELSRAFWGQGQ